MAMSKGGKTGLSGPACGLELVLMKDCDNGFFEQLCGKTNNDTALLDFLSASCHPSPYSCIKLRLLS